jgi:hypothetical protein
VVTVNFVSCAIVDGPYNKYLIVIISRMRGGYNKLHAHFKYEWGSTSFVGIFACRYTNMGITMNKWTLEGCTKAMVQGRPHLARSGRTTVDRSWPQPATAGQSQPHLARARLGRTNRCVRTYHMPLLGSTAPTIPQTHLGWMRYTVEWSVWSKGSGSKHVDRWTHSRRNRHQGVIQDVPQHRR